MPKYAYLLIAGMLALFFAAVFVHPWFLPGRWLMVVVAGFIVLVGVSIGVLAWERESEAKENTLTLLPDRAALLAAIGVIGIGILLESALGVVDPWLFVALGTALIAREAAKWYRRGRAKKTKSRK